LASLFDAKAPCAADLAPVNAAVRRPRDGAPRPTDLGHPVGPLGSMRLPVLNPKQPTGALAAGPRSISAVRMLRVSVTDRCNFRCVYCMPAEGVRWLPKQELLSYEEICRVVRVATELHGVRHVKLTGGEPTVRSRLTELVASLRRLENVTDLSMTTNGFALADLADPLRQAGLDRVTVSLDSLDAQRFARITRSGRLDAVLAGIERALSAGFTSLKINCVVVRGTNEDEIVDFAEMTLRRPITVRFIEYMPMGDSSIYAQSRGFIPEVGADGRTRYRIADDELGPAGGCGAQDRGEDVFVPEAEMRSAIESRLGPLVPVERAAEPGAGPAVPWQLDRPDAVGRIGFISAMSQPFCDTCNRLRLTATGVLRSCLFEGGEVDLKSILRGGGSDPDLAEAMERCVALKPTVHSSRGNIQMSQIGG
jgi:cyclic pyranopterin phosphate synthase